jgi:protein TonB
MTAGRLVKPTAPVYPEQARAAGIEGTVTMRGLIGRDGMLKDIEVLSGPPELRQAAVDAAAKWEYEPYRLNGVPVEVTTTVTVNFRLGERHPAAPQSASPNN